MDESFQNVSKDDLLKSHELWGCRVDRVRNGFVLRLLTTTPRPGMEVIEHRIYFPGDDLAGFANILPGMIRGAGQEESANGPGQA